MSPWSVFPHGSGRYPDLRDAITAVQEYDDRAHLAGHPDYDRAVGCIREAADLAGRATTELRTARALLAFADQDAQATSDADAEALRRERPDWQRAVDELAQKANESGALSDGE